jgi:hypothetical protein
MSAEVFTARLLTLVEDFWNLQVGEARRVVRFGCVER